jgi:hypothetical protein
MNSSRDVSRRRSLAFKRAPVAYNHNLKAYNKYFALKAIYKIYNATQTTN